MILSELLWQINSTTGSSLWTYFFILFQLHFTTREKILFNLFSSVQSFLKISKTIDTEGCGSRQSCRIAAVLRRKGRKKSSQVKFPFFRCFYWRFSDIVLNSVDREGQKNIGVCVSAQRQSLLFQHLYLSCVISHFLPCHRRTAETPFLTAKSHILCFQATTQGTSGSPPVQDGFL